MGLQDATILAVMLAAAFTVGGLLQRWVDRRDSARQVDRVIDASVLRERAIETAAKQHAIETNAREEAHDADQA